MRINRVKVKNNECIVPLLSFNIPTVHGFSFTKKSVMEAIMNNDCVNDKLKNGLLYMELLQEPMYAQDVDLNRYCEVKFSPEAIICIKDFRCYKDELKGCVEIRYLDPSIIQRFHYDFKTEMRFVLPNVKKEKGGFEYADSFKFITFDIMPRLRASSIELESIVRRNEIDKAENKWYLFGTKIIKSGDEPMKLKQENTDFAHLDNEHFLILRDLIGKSRLPTKDSSIEITALEKAEEELIELLAEIRKLKNCFSPVKSKRKGYTEKTRSEIIDNVVKEIGDVIVDVVYGLSTIIPLINVDFINEAAENKFEKYKKVVERLKKDFPDEENDYNIIEKLEEIRKDIEKAQKTHDEIKQIMYETKE
jgi:hypothetical protein